MKMYRDTQIAESVAHLVAIAWVAGFRDAKIIERLGDNVEVQRLLRVCAAYDEGRWPILGASTPFTCARRLPLSPHSRS